jgi:hypothetical protein
VSTIRRIYAYLLSIVGLAALAVAVANLAQLVLDVLLRAPPTASDRYVRDTAALYGAAALVSLPVWLLHWRWIQRAVAANPTERANVLRRLYLYAILTGAALSCFAASRDFLVQAFEALVGARGLAAGDESIARPLTFMATAAVVWIGHWRIANLDRELVGETGGSATLRRWYLYLDAFVGLMVLLSSTQSLVELLWQQATGSVLATAAAMAQAAAGALAGLWMWLGHWWLLPSRLPRAARRDDGTSALRSVYLFLALAVAVVGTLFGASQLLYYAVARLLGVGEPGGVSGTILEAAAGPASVTLVFGAAWAYQRAALRRQEQLYQEAPRQADVRYFYVHLVALIALATWTVGVTGLLWTLADVAFNSTAAIAPEAWRNNVALFTTLTMVGLPVWLVHWRPSVDDPREARSQGRRLYLYLSLIAATLAFIGGAAAALYRVLGLALGEPFAAQVAHDLLNALAVSLVAGLVAGYHWQILRADARRGGPAEAAIETSLDAEAVRALVEIRAADADALARALSALRATGVEVTER